MGTCVRIKELEIQPSNQQDSSVLTQDFFRDSDLAIRRCAEGSDCVPEGEDRITFHSWIDKCK